MQMRHYIPLAALLLLIASSAWADSFPTGGIVVTSNPPGAQVTLKGDVLVSGVTPARFGQLMVGSYELTVEMFGYEKYHSRVTIDPSKEVTVDVRLSAKSRIKSVVRSAFIPGWGQRYVEQNKKGLLMTLLAASTVAVYLKADGSFDDKKQDYDNLVFAFEKAETVAEQRRLAGLISTAKAEAYDAEKDRRIAIGAVAVAWGINMLDALVFFPENRGTFSVKSFSYVPQSDGITLGLSFTKAF